MTLLRVSGLRVKRVIFQKYWIIYALLSLKTNAQLINVLIDYILIILEILHLKIK